MGVNEGNSSRSISSFFLKEKLPFAPRAEVDWQRVKTCAFSAVGIGVAILLFLPPASKNSRTLNPDISVEITEPVHRDSGTPTDRALELMSSASGHTNSRPFGLGTRAQAAGAKTENSMIVAREGSERGSHLPAGSRIQVKLTDNAVVADQAMPVIGEVLADALADGSVAIPRGSKVFGQISFDASSERARIDWKSIRFPDGRERPFAGIGVGEDGQVGVEGDVRSQFARNVGGQMLTRFVAAYAEGSMQKGPLGSSEGGSENGLKYAVAETAKDRANAWAEGLSKESKWIEVSQKQSFAIVLTQAFAFRDPGFTHGR